MLHYNIEVRDINGNLFIRPNGGKVTNCFRAQYMTEDPIEIEAICRHLYSDYSTIAGSCNINISVSVFNSISGTWMNMYSFYGNPQQFIKHS